MIGGQEKSGRLFRIVPRSGKSAEKDPDPGKNLHKRLFFSIQVFPFRESMV